MRTCSLDNPKKQKVNINYPYPGVQRTTDNAVKGYSYWMCVAATNVVGGRLPMIYVST